MSETHTHDADPGLAEALAAEYAHNCATVEAASEDMHHRNLARMALLQGKGVGVPGFDLLNMKLEILLDEVVGDDVLRRRLVGMKFQQRLSDLLTQLETEPATEE